MKFSQRYEYTPSTKSIQYETMDIELKNGLWNALRIHIINKIEKYNRNWEESDFYFFSIIIWRDLFKIPIDEIPESVNRTEIYIKNYFFDSNWYEALDFIEFVANIDQIEFFLPSFDFKNYCNKMLEREFSAYRFIGDYITPISNEYEIKGIENALIETDSNITLRGINIHLKSALEKLSDRKNPDYRNSIKESISAVESMCKIISKNDKATLSSTIGKLKNNIEIHTHLESGFKNIYNYTSDSDGIRHALTDNPNCDFEDAKYMLVSCSAFINYLIVKANKAGLI